jgi:hypothetical protein
MIMGVVYQGNPHHYFPFMNKEKDGDSKAESSRLPSSFPVHSSSSSSDSSMSSSSDLKFSSNLTDRDSGNPSIVSTSGSGSSTTYQKNKYGFEERVGSIKQQSPKSENYDTYTKNKYGFEEKTGSIKQVSQDRKAIYEKNKYGFEEKVGSMKKNSSGGYDVYRKNKHGFEERVGSVK